MAQHSKLRPFFLLVFPVGYFMCAFDFGGRSELHLPKLCD